MSCPERLKPGGCQLHNLHCGYPACDRRTVDNPPMALSNKEKQEAFRARNAMLGMTEVRGVYLPTELHADLKRLARELLERSQRNPNRPAGL